MDSFLLWVLLGGLISVVLLAIKSHHRARLEGVSFWQGLRRHTLWELVGEVGMAGFASCVVAGVIEHHFHKLTNDEHTKHLDEMEEQNTHHKDDIEKQHAKHVKETDEQHARHKEEMKQSYELQRVKIAENVFLHTIGVDVDRSLREELRETIFSKKLWRKNFKVSYEFLPRPARADQPKPSEQLLLYRITVSYTVKNMGLVPSPLPITPSWQEVLPLNKEEGRFVFFEVKQNEKSLVKREGPDLTRTDGIRRSLILDKAAEVEVGPQDEVEVKLVYESAGRYQDRSLLVTIQPAENMTIEAILGHGAPDLEFVPDSMHRKKPEPVDPNHPERKEWIIKNGILPYQGVMLYWFPKSTQAVRP